MCTETIWPSPTYSVKSVIDPMSRDPLLNNSPVVSFIAMTLSLKLPVMFVIWYLVTAFSPSSLSSACTLPMIVGTLASYNINKSVIHSNSVPLLPFTYLAYYITISFWVWNSDLFLCVYFFICEFYGRKPWRNLQLRSYFPFVITYLLFTCIIAYICYYTSQSRKVAISIFSKLQFI